MMMKKWMLPALFVITACAASLVAYADLPEQMVMHFGPSQQPDRLMTKDLGAFLLPVIILLNAVLMILFMKLERNENKRLRIEASIGSISSIISVTLLMVHMFFLGYNLGYKLNVAVFVTIIVGIVFIFMGNLLPRLRQSSKQWPKLPEHVQGRAARFQGKLMFILGFVFLLLALLPGSYILPAFIGSLAGFLLAMFGSFIYYFRLR